MTFALTAKQEEARAVLGSPAMHCMLFGGSRSGKTFIGCHTVAARAIAAPKSRHAILRYRLNAVKTSVGYDTLPKVLSLAWPSIPTRFDKQENYFEFENGSQIWLVGLDDKERTEKILGMEFATVYLNECSQIPWGSRNIAMTRLAQNVEIQMDGFPGRPLRLKAFYDCNPPSTSHWTYKVFVRKRDPETNEPLPNPEQYATLLMNPGDNRDNLAPEYIASLEAMPAKMRMRFLEGRFTDATPDALWRLEDIEKWRAMGELPDMQRIVVAIDPSGTDGDDTSDAVGIVVCGLGVDGNGYVLEDLTVNAGPQVWGNVAVTAFDRWRADILVAETNYGGAMVKGVIDAQRRGIPFRAVTASRGKVVRAEPISSLAEQGKIRHAGRFHRLEDELCAFTQRGYMGDRSPNRADAMVWAFSELFPAIGRQQRAKVVPSVMTPQIGGNLGWMGR